MEKDDFKKLTKDIRELECEVDECKHGINEVRMLTNNKAIHYILSKLESHIEKTFKEYVDDAYNEVFDKKERR